MERIEIRGYKSIKDLDLKLRPINILIGSNGSGKSNFLSFFDFVTEIFNNNLREYIALRGIDTFLHKGDKVTEAISAHIHLNSGQGYSFVLKKGEQSFIFTNETIWKNNFPHLSNSFYSETAFNGPNRFFEYESITSGLESIAKYHFHDTGRNSPFNKETHIDNDKFKLYKDGSNLGAFLYDIKSNEPNTYRVIIKTIQSIAPYFHDFYLPQNIRGLLKVRWQSKHSESIYGVNDLSDGTIRFIALTTLFLQPNLPQTIIIDEPELGLHPTAIAKLAGLIQTAAAKGCQVIVATQSTDLISHFQPEDIITVDNINGESVFERLSSETLKDWLENYTIDDLWKRNIISTGQPNF